MDNSWALSRSVFNWIESNIRRGSTIVELGSGTGTIELMKNYEVVSIEHDPKYVKMHPGNCVYAPILNGWYDTERVKGKLPGKMDLVIIDGPPGIIGRQKVMDHLYLFDLKVPFLLDDTNRPAEKALATALSMKLGRQPTWFKTEDIREFAVV